MTFVKKKSSGYDEQYFNQLVYENHQRIYNLFRRMVQTHAEADDLTQETFIRVYQNLGTFRGEAAPATWIYRIAVNAALNYLRKQKIRHTLSLELARSVQAADEPENVHHEQILLRRALTKLPARQQMIVVLRIYQELPFREIASILNSTENAAKVNFSHAVKSLRQILIKMGVSHDHL